MLQRLLKSQNRIYEPGLTIVIKQDIVAVLSDICHKHIIVGKGISPLWSQSEPAKMFGNLPVIGARIRPHGLLSKYKPCFMKFLCNTKKFKSAIREENIMDYVLKQHILWRMLFEV